MTTIEILGKYYTVKCPDTEIASLQEAANYLNQQMKAVQDSGKAINLERIAIITALNIANQYLQVNQQKSSFMDKINQRIVQMQDKIEAVVNQSSQTEMLYSIE